MERRIFESENEAAAFIAQIKTQDPRDEFVYVICADPLDPEKFVIEIYSPNRQFLGIVRAQSQKRMRARHHAAAPCVA